MLKTEKFVSSLEHYKFITTNNLDRESAGRR